MLVRVGVDVVDLDRFRATISRTPRFVERVFTTAERMYSLSIADPTPRLGARFAAKEATMKALGVGIGAIGWHEAEVGRLTTGQPTLLLSGRAAGLAKALGIDGWTISLSHAGNVAIASVVAIGPGVD